MAKKEREPFLKWKYEKHLQDLSDSECREWLLAIFHYRESWEMLENISWSVKSIIRQQIEEREENKINYWKSIEQRINAVKSRWNKQKQTTTQNTTQKKKYLDFVELTDEEYEKLKEKLWSKREQAITELNNYIWSSWKKYKSHYFTILKWNAEYIKEMEKRKLETQSLPNTTSLLWTIKLRR